MPKYLQITFILAAVVISALVMYSKLYEASTGTMTLYNHGVPYTINFRENKAQYIFSLIPILMIPVGLISLAMAPILFRIAKEKLEARNASN